MDWIEFRLKQILLEELFEVPKEQVLLWWAKFNERPQFAVEWGNSDWMDPFYSGEREEMKSPDFLLEGSELFGCTPSPLGSEI